MHFRCTVWHCSVLWYFIEWYRAQAVRPCEVMNSSGVGKNKLTFYNLVKYVSVIKLFWYYAAVFSLGNILLRMNQVQSKTRQTDIAWAGKGNRVLLNRIICVYVCIAHCTLHRISRLVWSVVVVTLSFSFLISPLPFLLFSPCYLHFLDLNDESSVDDWSKAKAKSAVALSFHINLI